ncbi:hypothetical protein [Pedobacter gandavensis]|uniref:hypothetical protein n=1 Tax=Pedobacter gandavensis TaxID=2679963 RepID=UPI00292D4195|nr:hypothetical protein [Pedobacter gandavensis]
MAKLFIFGIGGTGSRVIKSLTMLLAAGMKSSNNFEIVPIIIDPHKDNEDLKRTVATLNNYQKITEKVGSDNGFFGTKVSTLQSLDQKLGLGGTYTFKLKDVESTKFKDYFSYNSLDEENMALADLIFSGKTINHAKDPVNLLDIPMDIGFVGNPNVGSVVLNQFKHSEEFKTFANNFGREDRVFIISSIFGGTGAAGFPTILKSIRDANEQSGISNAGFLRDASIGALTVMPYFNIAVDENSPINKSDFVEKTKAALDYYRNNVNDDLNAMYYIGDDYVGKAYENDPGNNGQKNDAHFVELAGAMSILDFMNLNTDDLLTENGKPERTRFREYGIKEDLQQLFFGHLGDGSSQRLGKCLTQFTLFNKYLNVHLDQAIENKTWSTSPPAIDKQFKNSQFFSSNLSGFLKQYSDWLNELQNNSRSFKPFNLDADLMTLVNGRFIAKKFLVSSFDYDSYDMKLNRLVRDVTYVSAEQKLINLFYTTTENISQEKYGYQKV